MKHFKKLWILIVALAFFFSLTQALETRIETMETRAGTIEEKAEMMETRAETILEKAEMMETKAEEIGDETMLERIETMKEIAETMETRAETMEEKADTMMERAEMMEDVAENRAEVMEERAEAMEEKAEMMEERKETIKQRIKMGKHMVETMMEIKQERINDKEEFKVRLKNGRNALIKIMPEVAAERAIERLHSRKCLEEDDCQIELKEVGQGDETKAIYEIKTIKEVKILGLFRARMKITTQVDAEDGEVIKDKKPRRSFFTRSYDDTDDVNDTEEEVVVE